MNDEPVNDDESSKPLREPVGDHRPQTARVPERWTRGVYSTGQLIHDSPKEFAIDFFHGLTRPHQVVARVVMTPETMEQFVRALRTSLDNYTRTFGPPPALPALPASVANEPRPSVEDIYDTFKLSDEMIAGCYANEVLIGHSPTEFFFDFIARFYPTPAVSARVYIAASQSPRFISTLETCVKRYRERHEK